MVSYADSSAVSVLFGGDDVEAESLMCDLGIQNGGKLEVHRKEEILTETWDLPASTRSDFMLRVIQSGNINDTWFKGDINSCEPLFGSVVCDGEHITTWELILDGGQIQIGIGCPNEYDFDRNRRFLEGPDSCMIRVGHGGVSCGVWVEGRRIIWGDKTSWFPANGPFSVIYDGSSRTLTFHHDGEDLGTFPVSERLAGKGVRLVVGSNGVGEITIVSCIRNYG